MSLDISLEIFVDTGGKEIHSFELYSGNYTHNVTPMWHKAGVYGALYESHKQQASEIITTLESGIVEMESKPEEYKALNSPNGWGNYETALEFLREFTAACKQHPKAIISVSR